MTAQKLKIVHIISGDRWAGAEVQAYTLLCELKSRVHLHTLVLNEGDLASRLRKKGITVTVLDESKLNSFAILRALIRQLRQIRPHIVHTHRQKENVLGSLANLLSIRTKSVRTVHGAPEFSLSKKQRIQTWMDDLCGRYLQQAVVAVSDALAIQLQSRFSPASIHTIVNGINPRDVNRDLDIPEFKQRYPQHIHVGIAGRVEPVKRVDLFLQMARLLLKEHPQQPWLFHVFGDGSLLAGMKDLAAELNISDRVSFHGHRNDIGSCIKSLKVLVMPSDHEGLPMTALEALALGTPLVAHATGGLPDLMCKQQNLLSQAHTAEDYSRLVFRLSQTAHYEPEFPVRYLATQNATDIVNLYNSLSDTGRPKT